MIPIRAHSAGLIRRGALLVLTASWLACVAFAAQLPATADTVGPRHTAAGTSTQNQSPLTAKQWLEIGTALGSAAEQERASQGIPSIALGIVDARGQGWQSAFGTSDPGKTRAADVNGLYRIGSLTKLMTDVLVMQQVEHGNLDLDAPVQRYLKDFAPRNPFGKPVTLRLLMTHHSGLAEEPPRGHYYDSRPPALSDIVRSLNQTSLLTEPGTTYRYSNAALAVVGRVLEVATGKSYDQLLQQALLLPLGMSSTSLHLTPQVRSALAYAEMAPFDDVRSPAPLFDLGTASAGNVYSNVGDVSKFAIALLNGGATVSGRILQSASVDKMWSSQIPPDGATPLGIGFFIRSLDGHRSLGHTGGVYGYVTDLAIYPDDGFSVIVMMALNEADPARVRLRNYAARLVFAARVGEPMPHYASPSDVIPEALAKRLAGHYSNGASSLELRVVDKRSYLEAPGVAAELRRAGDRFVLDDVLTSRDDVSADLEGGTVTLAGTVYQRAPRPQPLPPEAAFSHLIGDYGWQYAYLRIYERDGVPYVRIGSSDYEPLEVMGNDLYRLAAGQPGQQLQFTRNRAGEVDAIRFNDIVWPRHDFGAEAEARVHAVVREVPGLRETAWQATPPAGEPGLRTPELVEVARFEPSVKLDIGYARRDNFMGIAVYDEPRAFLQRPAAEALIRAHERLGKDHGYGILIHDTYRPWAVTKMFWDATPPAAHDFVADPSKGSKHNRGCAADITLYDRASGETLEMTGRYDETSARSMPFYIGGSSLQRWRRDLLKAAVEAEGFDVYRYEWWHFDHHLWRQYPVMNLNFRDVPATDAQP